MDPSSLAAGALVPALWHVVAKYGLPTLAGPYRWRAEGGAQVETKVHERLALAQADFQVAAIQAGALTYDSTTRRLSQTLLSPDEDLPLVAPHELAVHNAARQAFRSEINIANTLLKTEDHLRERTTPAPAETVATDWFHRWRSSVAEVSDERMQDVWARLLAGEVESPGHYSLRLQQLLRVLTADDAQRIERLFSYLFLDAIVVEAPVEKYLHARDLGYGRLLEISELGLLSGIEAGLTKAFYSSIAGSFYTVVAFGQKALTVRHPSPTHRLSLKVYKATAVAQELATLGSFAPDYEYLTLIGDFIKSQDRSRRVTLAEVGFRTGDHIGVRSEIEVG